MTDWLELPAAFFGALLLYRFVCSCMGLEGGFPVTISVTVEHTRDD